MPYPFFVVYSPAYNVDIGPHVFKTDKYRLIMGKLAKVLDLSDDRILTPEPAPPESLLSALDPAYYDDLIHCRQTWRTISAELPINREIIDSVLICAGGSILAARKAIECHGVVFHNGGGWHHAFRDHAEGFCYINDVALAILAMKHEEKICKAMVIDLDLHHSFSYFRILRSALAFSWMWWTASARRCIFSSGVVDLPLMTGSSARSAAALSISASSMAWMAW